MFYGSNDREAVILRLILRYWEIYPEKILEELGGIIGGYRNEERIAQIVAAIEDLKQSSQSGNAVSPAELS